MEDGVAKREVRGWTGKNKINSKRKKKKEKKGKERKPYSDIINSSISINRVEKTPRRETIEEKASLSPVEPSRWLFPSFVNRR